VYRPALEVPLIVKRPGQIRGKVVTESVSLVDVPRLILSGVSPALLARHTERFQYEPGNHPIIAENYFSRMKDIFHPSYGHRFRRVRVALLDDTHKLIHSSDGKHELYSLRGDPDESKDLIAELPQRAREMSERWEQLQSVGRWSASGGGGIPLDPEQIEELRAMGYLEDGDVATD